MLFLAKKGSSFNIPMNIRIKPSGTEEIFHANLNIFRECSTDTSHARINRQI